MKMPQLKIGMRGREVALGNWEECQRWAYCHSPIWHAATIEAERRLGLSEADALRLIAWSVLGALQDQLLAAQAAAGVHDINPGNEGLTQLRGQWEKVLLVVMRQQGLEEVTLDLADFERAFPAGSSPTFAVIGRKDVGPHGGFKLRIANNEAEAIAIVAQHQGKG